MESHRWIPPELPVLPEVPTIFSEGEREERKVAYIRELARYELKPGVDDKEEVLEESDLEVIADYFVLAD